jgi:hypothetical protein
MLGKRSAEIPINVQFSRVNSSGYLDKNEVYNIPDDFSGAKV